MPTTEDLPQLDGTEHLQADLRVPGQLGGGVDEHLIPRLNARVDARQKITAAIRLGKSRVEVWWWTVR